MFTETLPMAADASRRFAATKVCGKAASSPVWLGWLYSTVGRADDGAGEVKPTKASKTAASNLQQRPS